MSIEAPASPEVSTPSPAPEPTATVKPAGGDANPATLPTRSELKAERRQEARAQFEKLRKEESGRTQDASAPSPSSTATPPEGFEKEDAPADKPKAKAPPAPNPKETPKEPAKDADAPKSLKVSRTDKDGKAVEVEISLDQARRAILRDGYSTAGMKPEQILEVGARRYLHQTEFDRNWSERQEEVRRLTEENARLKGSPSSPVKTAKPEGEAKAAPPPSAEPPLSMTTPPAAPAQDPETQAAFAALQDQLGPDAAAALIPLLQKLQRPTVNPFQSEVDRLNSALESQRKQYEQQYNGVTTVLMQNLFDRGFNDFSAEFPQLEGKSSDAVRSEIQADWSALAQSGRWQNPLEPAAFKSVLREAIHARLGDQIQETHARQLQQRQRLEKAGQIPSTESRADKPAQAMSPRDRQKAVLRELIANGPEAAQRRSLELERLSG